MPETGAARRARGRVPAFEGLTASSSIDEYFMATDILMPDLSPTMEEGKLSKWLKKAGDPVKSGDVLAEIETDKATMEVEAIDEGVLAKILVEEGTEGVKVNTPIAIIAAEDEDVSAAAAGGGASKPEASAQPAPAPDMLAEGQADTPAPSAKTGDDAPKAPAAPATITNKAPAPVMEEFPEGTEMVSTTVRKPCAMPWPRRCARTTPSS